MDHSEEYERDETENEELVLSNETQKEGDGDDLVDTDTDRSENIEIDQRKHHDLHRTLHSLTIWHAEYSVDTDIDLESNLTRKLIWVLLLWWQHN